MQERKLLLGVVPVAVNMHGYILVAYVEGTSHVAMTSVYPLIP